MPLPEFIHFSIAPKGISLAGSKPVPKFTAEDLEAARREGYHRGSEEATRVLEHQLVQQRSELVHLQSETFSAVERQHAAVSAQFRAMVPELVMEAVARILANTTPDRAVVLRVVEDLLQELNSSKDPVEVRLHPSDLALILGYEENLRTKHSALTFQADHELQPGDCLVRSRFGVIDGRLSTKFRAVEAMLT